jgi:pyruvate,water dikinase
MSGSAPPCLCLPLTSREPTSPELLARLGGKAGPLRRLAALGYPVWPGVVLLPPEHAPARPAAAIQQQLSEALAHLPRGSGSLAVRSSAPLEDGAECSYAGQYQTLLHVAAEDLDAAILQVWSSAGSPSLAEYARLRAGPTERTEWGERSHAAGSSGSRLPAVLIQPILPARIAGVAFGADPVSGRRGITLIHAVPGLAADLVAGRSTGDRYGVGRDGRILEHQPRHPERPLLDTEALQRLSRLVRDLGRELGGPQDVEWALDGDGHLWLLQVRPITTLARTPDPDSAPGLWDNSNIVESYSGVTTPLTFSFARKAYTEVYQGFCRFMGVHPAVIRRHRGVFATMIGFQQGRIYYNLLSWYRVLSLLPGYGLNAACLEQMLGVREPLSAAERERLRLEPPIHPLRDLARLATALLGLLGNAIGLERRRRAFRRRLDRVLLEPAGLAELADARPDELVGHYRRIEAQLLSRWDAPLINDFYAMVVYGVLGGLLRRWGLDPDGRRLQSWISDLGAVISAEPHRRIGVIARQLAAEPDLVALLELGTLAQIQPALAARPALQAELNAYLDAFGDRCLGELKLETRTLRDDPLPLLRSLAAAARHGGSAAQPGDHSSPGSGPLPSRVHPLQGLLLGWLRRRLRRLLAERENLRFERTRVFGQARRILIELGRRFRELGLIDQADDVVFLEVEEVLAVVEGTATCCDLRALVNLRRQAGQRHRSAPPLPRRFRTRGIPSLDLPGSGRPEGSDPGADRASVPRSDADPAPWQGLGCSPGRVSAPVARVGDPIRWLDERRQPRGPRPILVAQATDPGWVLLFPHAAGLLVERGSALSHVAIVAREVGLPMVTELAGISTRLADGDRIELDGGTGQVRLLLRAGDGQ